MKDRFDEIIERLRAQQPMIENGELLIERIMDSLPELSGQKECADGNRKTGRLLQLSRVISSAAAVVLILLFVWQNRYDDGTETQKKDYEQCIARYKSDWNFDGCDDLRAVGKHYAKMKESQKSIINKLKTKYYENE